MPLTPNSPRKRLEYALKDVYDPEVISAVARVTMFLMGRETNRKTLSAYDELLFALPDLDQPKEEQIAEMKAPREGAGHYQSRREGVLQVLDVFSSTLPDHHPADVLIPWIAREVARLAKAPTLTVKDWNDATQALAMKAPAIAQWARETSTDIGRVNLAQAFDAMATYEFKESLIPEGEVVYEFPDGWTIQGLKGDPQLKAEGSAMQHCVGSYCEVIANGESKIFSLRDPEGNPHVTIEWRLNEDLIHRYLHEPTHVRKVLKGTYAQFFDEKEDVYIGAFGQRRKPLSWLGQVVQVYGKQNAPPKKKYEPYAQEFIREKLDGDEIGLFLAGVPAQKINWRGVSMRPLDGVNGLDFHGVDLRGADFSEDAFVFNQWDLSGASLAGRSLKMSAFSGRAREAVFDGADLAGATFDQVDLEDASFRGTHLDGAEFHRSTIIGINISGADLTGVTISSSMVSSSSAMRDDIAKEWLKQQKVVSDDETIWPDGTTYAVGARTRHA